MNVLYDGQYRMLILIEKSFKNLYYALWRDGDRLVEAFLNCLPFYFCGNEHGSVTGDGGSKQALTHF